jgi:hypothetical protein
MILNYTPHAIEVYTEASFEGLEKVNPTTWVADSVSGEAIVSLSSLGMIRVAVSTTQSQAVNGVPTVETTYGELEGLPESIGDGDYLVVSLPTQSAAKSLNHPLASRMLCPYQVVRSRANSSTVLGCMGFSR